jgi:hypothetical protein
MSKSNRIFLVVNLLIGAFLLGSMSSQSVSASESNVIIACANKSTGALRVSSKCSSTERLITWNKTGVQGPRGPDGSDAIANTKLVTIRYIGDGFSCGDGMSSVGTVKTYKSWSTDVSNLTSTWNWTSNTYCYITLRVVQ